MGKCNKVGRRRRLDSSEAVVQQNGSDHRGPGMYVGRGWREETERPETGGVGASAGHEKLVAQVDTDGGCVENDVTPRVAELAD